MSDQTLIRFCAPSLAGLKTGSLFTTKYSERNAFNKELTALNRILKPKGMRAVPLRFYEARVLIYVYRVSALAADLQKNESIEILKKKGYTPAGSAGCLSTLIRKMKEDDVFPHEIGLFLGYPAEDVKGFMEKGASGCKFTGYWKVYGDVEKSRKLFEIGRDGESDQGREEGKRRRGDAGGVGALYRGNRGDRVSMEY